MRFARPGGEPRWFDLQEASGSLCENKVFGGLIAWHGRRFLEADGKKLTM
jgi:hypothetical protein